MCIGTNTIPVPGSTTPSVAVPSPLAGGPNASLTVWSKLASQGGTIGAIAKQKLAELSTPTTGPTASIPLLGAPTIPTRK